MIVGFALGLFVMGVAVGGLIENTRLSIWHAVDQKKSEERLSRERGACQDPVPEILFLQASELRCQSKKLDTLIMQQAFILDTPEITQEMPKAVPRVTQEIPVIEN